MNKEDEPITTIGETRLDDTDIDDTLSEQEPAVLRANTEDTKDNLGENNPLDTAMAVAKEVLLKVPEDCGAAFEAEAISALSYIHKHSPADYQRIRRELKKANKDVSIVDLDKLIQATVRERSYAQTHHGYATDILDRLTIGDWRPVGYQGSLYIADLAKNIWVKCPPEQLVRMIATNHDAKLNCAKSYDYNGIAQHALLLAGNDAFFEDAPIGLASLDLFYEIKDGEIYVEPLSPSHRQRVKIEVELKKQPTPMFDLFLHEAFQSSVPGEEEQQLVLLQEIAGAIMLGLMAKHHKAVLFYDPFGRAGKGTLERILRELVPAAFVTSVTPFNWDREYYLASLAGARLNVVGELPDSKPIPAAAFKTVTGGDLLTGRHPTHRPISFKNEAAHLFMSNHLINTSDHSEAFFTRWLLVEFPNSRVKNGKPIDPDLPERIIKEELPGIASWALNGALRLMKNNKFSKSAVHDRLMETWRRHANSLEEFIFECCERGSENTVRRSYLYERYVIWCRESGRHPFSKAKVKELLTHNIVLGISWASLDGYEIFRGIKLIQEEFHAM
jgi:putative DNA primase/helicase